MDSTSEALNEAVLRMPKVELHVHLEGATDAETIWLLAERNELTLPGDSLEQWRKHYEFKSFPHFIDVYETATSVMKTPEDWYLMVQRFLERQARQNIVYSEVFLSASYQIGRIRLEEWRTALVDAVTEAEHKFGVGARFIPDISRHLPDTQQEVLQFAVESLETGMFLGLGLGGIEEGFPASLFRDTFREARRRGLHVVAHAGETTGPQSVWDALNDLQAERIGHGFRCLEDPVLVQQLRDSQLPLEVCPTSNYRLGLLNPNEPHPIRRMVDEGLCCTINSDDPPMFGTSLIGEFQLLAKQGFAWRELVRLNLNAVESSFLANEQKCELRDRIHKATMDDEF